jgi:hypothetical protein
MTTYLLFVDAITGKWGLILFTKDWLFLNPHQKISKI